MRGMDRAKRIAVVFSIVLGAVSASYAETVQLDVVPQKNRLTVPGEVIIEIKKDVIDLGKERGRVPAQEAAIGSEMMAELCKRYKLISIERLFSGTRKDTPSDIYVFRFLPDANIDEVISAFKKDPNVVYAEPNYVMHTMEKGE